MARFRRDVFRSRTASMVARFLALLGIEHGRWAIRRVYALAPTMNVSRLILEACPHRLAVSRVTDLRCCSRWAGSGWPSRRGECS